MIIDRKQEVKAIQGLLRRHPVVGMIGARQVGKTTLARLLIEKTKGPSSYFDLEDPEDLARIWDPMLALKDLEGLVVIDEIQRQPNLFRRLLHDIKPLT
jgi:predicted AAA+ superfamily ATPase